ncbi:MULTISPECIES: hypothetical protein [Rhodococcus]|uniref:hypothetical protein n=1 Tax=Rhodococcus sp. A14 TaxID=1194106 RepID=UPI0010628B3B|nr:hypothetical protein [Rhodococcus sp. A14]
MTTLALIALGVAAVAPLALAAPRSPRWMSQWAAPIVVALALAVAELAASATTPVTGFALAATLVLCVAAAATGGAPLVLAAFRIARRQPDAGSDQRPDAGPLRGGRIIGLLERAAVAASILAGWPEGIAVVLAVKGLARYPELREPHASEQFIIGTFASVLWAIAVCGTGRALIT